MKNIKITMRDERKGNRLVAALALAFLPMTVHAQFDSGSTGTDPLDVTSNTTLPLPADGVLQYTTINVAGGVTLTFQRNAANTPVIMLATGDVTIDGTINIAGQSGRSVDDALAGTLGSETQPGPGGFPGGIGAIPESRGGTGIGTPGGGPGGGAAATDATAGANGWGRGGNGGSHFFPGGVGSGNPNPAAPTYGDPRMISLTGGSGGAGGNMIIDASSNWDGAGGGAGGGGILIASSGTITVSGTINADGGTGHGAVASGGGGSHGSGGGGGGTIRLMANTIAGNGTLVARGGGGVAVGGNGRIRLEAFSFSGSIANSPLPPPIVSSPIIVRFDPNDIPTIRIATIAGIAVPDPSTGSTSSPDIIIPSSTTNPITIGIVTTNMPNGAIIRLRIVLENGTVLTADSTPVASNAATASVDLSTGIGVIYATADF